MYKKKTQKMKHQNIVIQSINGQLFKWRNTIDQKLHEKILNIFSH
jgi:hypothetical protein